MSKTERRRELFRGETGLLDDQKSRRWWEMGVSRIACRACRRSKLYAYGEAMLDKGSGKKTWLERGVGEMKILKCVCRGRRRTTRGLMATWAGLDGRYDSFKRKGWADG